MTAYPPLDPRKPTDAERIAALERIVEQMQAELLMLTIADRERCAALARLRRALKTAQSFDELESKLGEGE